MKPPAPNEPLRVLYVHPFAQAVSGPDESLRVLLRALGPRVKATIALPPGSPFANRFMELGATLAEQRIARLRRFGGPLDVAHYGGQLTVASTSLLMTALRVRPHVIHANMEVCLEAGLVARALTVPCVFHYRGNTNASPKLVFDVLTRAWTGLGTHVFAISRGCADIFTSRGLGAKVEVLYNAVELSAFAPVADQRAKARAALALNPDDVAIFSVARIHPRKDVRTLIRAAAEVCAHRASARFFIVGDAEGAEGLAYEAELRALADSLGVSSKITWLGARSDVPALLQAADAFVMTSRHEGFGRAAAEAMAAGLPCVLTREGAFPELVDDGVHGFLAGPEDADEFARALDRLCDDGALRVRLGTAGRKRALARYDATAQAERVLEVYRALVEHRVPPLPASGTTSDVRPAVRTRDALKEPLS